MKPEHYVVVGNGAAANRAAEVLRQGDPEGRITLVSDEKDLFYFRHKLRKYISGAFPEEELRVHPLEWYRQRNIRLRLGQRVTCLDAASRTLYLQHMEKLSFTRLLVCCGSRPRIPEPLWEYRRLFTVVKTLDHARALRQRLPAVRSIFVAGGDLVSFRLTEEFLALGREVTFLVDRDAFWPLTPTPEQRREFAGSLARRGARVIQDDEVAALSEAGGGLKLRLASGGAVSCDLAGGFFGLVPDVDFLLGSGLDIDRGIMVNEFLQTNLEDIYAAGDCAQVYNPSLRSYWTSVGWPNARNLGETAALNILGDVVRAGRAKSSILSMEGVSVSTPWWQDRVRG